MSNLIMVLKEIDEAFNSKDRDKAYSLGVKMAHLGWFNRLSWFIKEYTKRFGKSEDVCWFKVVKYVISRMDYYKAIKCVNNVPTRRILYEYLGLNPLAYRYSLKEFREDMDSSPEWRGFWEGIKIAYFKLYKGESVEYEEIEGLKVVEGPFEIPGMLMKSYVKCLYNLMNEIEDMQTFKETQRILSLSIKEGYHHTALRVLQAFIPYMMFMGFKDRVGIIINTAIDTAKASASRYMYEWFVIYKHALEGSEIERSRLGFYIKNRYMYHTLMSYYTISSDDPRLNKYANRYWHKHTLRFIKVMAQR